MKIPGKLYHAISARHVNTIETDARIRPAADGYVHLATKIDVAIGFAITKGYDRIVVFKAEGRPWMGTGCNT